jgi:hypothetical protein
MGQGQSQRRRADRQATGTSRPRDQTLHPVNVEALHRRMLCNHQHALRYATLVSVLAYAGLRQVLCGSVDRPRALEARRSGISGKKLHASLK